MYLATGENYPDALAGAPAAAAEGAPILLTRPDHLPDPTAAYLQSNPVVRVVILGGEGVVFPAVRAVVAALTGT